MNKLLNLQEMAKYLGVSAQTFRKDLKDKNIPHLIVGKRTRFDPVRVEAYLVATAAQPSNVTKLKLPPAPKQQRTVGGSRFAEKINGGLPG